MEKKNYNSALFMRYSLRVAKISTDAILPTKSTLGSVAFDLYSPKDYVISGLDKCTIPTDLQIALPVGTAGMIMSCSGLAFKHNIVAFSGLIDGDYRGNLSVLLFNDGDFSYRINKGDRIAQLLLVKINEIPSVVHCESIDDIEKSVHLGFGSSGI